jgi:hypothetical protein
VHVARWHASPFEFYSEPHPGRVQPYGLYVPSGYRPGVPAPVIWMMHGTNENHNGFVGKTWIPGWCEAANAICIAPFERGHGGLNCGNSGENAGNLDVWEVWHDVAVHFTLDPTRTVMGGMSFGGICTSWFGDMHPDMFGRICNLEGVVAVDPRLENLRWLPDYLAVTAGDELTLLEWTTLQQQTLDGMGYRYQFDLFPVGEHFTGDMVGSLEGCRAFVGPSIPTAKTRPGHVTYSWDPTLAKPGLGLTVTGAYWLDDLVAANATLTSARVDAVSEAQPDAPMTPVRTRRTGTYVSPFPVVTQMLDWMLGSAPPRRPALTLTLANTNALGIDLVGAGVADYPTGSATIATDSRTRLTLKGMRARARVTRDGAMVGTAGPDGTCQVQVSAGTHVVAWGRAGR